MIKKLFNRKKKERNNCTVFGKGLSNNENENTKGLNEYQQKVKETIGHRHVFRYNFCQSWAEKRKSECYTLFCCRICCGRRRASKEDKMHKRGQQKLY
jgi:hypothetical protein